MSSDPPTLPSSHPPISPSSRPWWLGRRALLAFWVLSGLLLAAVAYLTPLERTQEARVLVGAREMFDAGWRDWLIPHNNGRIRVQKPPLAYWASAASFRVFGVGVFTGRLPMVLATWLTIALVWAIARRMLSERAAFFAAAALAGSLFILRFGRLAETDTVSLPLLTLAVYAFWRAVAVTPHVHAGLNTRWYHLASLCIGLVANAKGLSAALPLACFVGFAWAEKPRMYMRGSALWAWARCGAPITLLLIAAPWWIYVLVHLGGRTFWKELHDVSTGSDHPGWPWMPLADTLAGALPWSGFVLLAIAAAAPHWRSNPKLRGLLVWAAGILVPLCILPQKQAHYDLPALPPLMILVGWLLDRAASGLDQPLRRATIWVFGGTTLVGLAGAAAPVIAGGSAHGKVQAMDIATSCMIAAGMLLLIVWYYRRGLLPALAAGMFMGAILLAHVLGVYGPSVQGPTMASVARAIQTDYPDVPYVYYRTGNLVLLFEMRRIIPTSPTPPEPTSGQLVVISEGKSAPLKNETSVREFRVAKTVMIVSLVGSR